MWCVFIISHHNYRDVRTTATLPSPQVWIESATPKGLTIWTGEAVRSIQEPIVGWFGDWLIHSKRSTEDGEQT